MATPVKPYYIVLPSIWTTELFKAVVDVMDEMSPPNSSTATTSQNLSDHQLSHLVAKPDDPTEVALKDLHQEMVEFTDDEPLSL